MILGIIRSTTSNTLIPTPCQIFNCRTVKPTINCQPNIVYDQKYKCIILAEAISTRRKFTQMLTVSFRSFH